MKFIYSISFLLFSCFILRGQPPTFSPIGTKWGYSYSSFLGSGGLIKEAVGDTVIKGRICRKFINTDRGVTCGGPTCLPFLRTSVSFIAQSQDSIFLFQPWDSTFRFMYHFHSQVGDTMTTQFNTNTQLKYVCMRVSDTLLGGTLLKKWQFIQICSRNNTFPIILLEKVGAFQSPTILPNACLSDDTYYGTCSFQSGHINFQGTNCITATDETTLSKGVELSPNPASTFLKIESSFIFSDYKIVDMNGKTHQIHAYTEGEQIDISKLTAGIYFLQLIDNKGFVIIKRFIKL